MSPTAVVALTDGSRLRAELAVGQDAKLLLSKREIVIRPVEFFLHAMRHPHVLPADAGDEDAGPGLKVEVAVGQERQTVHVPFGLYVESIMPQPVPLPDGRKLAMSFSRARRALPAQVQVTYADYRTHPGSGIPKDYVCRLRIVAGGEKRTETLSLNQPVHVGEYQLSQGSWKPRPDMPEEIVLGVASRPGLWVIWAGCAMISLGFPYAFYVKPLLLRRSRRAAREVPSGDQE
jgi:hypothetical protein